MKKRKRKRKEFLYSLLIHDVQNKNQVIRGYLELLKEENLGEEIEQKIEKALNAVSTSEKLINDVKTLLNIGRIDLKERKINKIIENALNEVRDLAQRKDFDINTNLKETKIVVCDLCEKLFTNIIENSIEHSNGNKIEIDVKDKNNHVVVSIEDDGKGIPNDKKDKIFEKNYATEGTGLGLYIVKEILNNSDGEIEVKDSDLGGTRFEVYLPKPE
ncbi:hypothetical protein C9439_05610 [archaeon SCG-AAA382B04]|nr:hypothetical protein C9439_05610 [archaeon SCG-AAA382B04]